MSERENTMELEVNPYDRLIEQEAAPVQSPVIFSASEKEPQAPNTEETIELIPLAADAEYREIEIKEYADILSLEFETEDDLLVPDIEPDMDAIINIRALVSEVSVITENDGPCIKGELKLETLYASAGSYGEPVCVIPAVLSFKKQIEEYHEEKNKPEVSMYIKKIEYRIINERKYKVRLYLQVSINQIKINQYKLFDGVKNGALQLKKEKIHFANTISYKTKESEVQEELLLKDEKIRPVKILKSDFVISENHRQVTKEKLILNESIWVRILYMAELASKGNLSTQPMLYCGKIDHTQFISFNKEERNISACQIRSDANKLHAEINREATGFNVSGDVSTEICLYNILEKETVIDFYHLKEELTCDKLSEKVCSGIHMINCTAEVSDTIDLNHDSDTMRIIHMDARVIESRPDEEDGKVIVRGKIQLEVAVIDDQDYVCTGRKVCDFQCDAVMPVTSGKICSCNVFVKQMQAELSDDNKAVISSQITAELNIHEETQLSCVSNPCIIRSGNPSKCYPITVYTVKDGEDVWNIAKKFKVTEESITQINKPECIRAGQKIIIVK